MTSSAPDPIFLFLHDAPGPADTWSHIQKALPDPGRSFVAELRGTDIDAATHEVAETIGTLSAAPVVLVAHGAATAVAALVARRADDGERGLQPLHRLVLLAASLGRDEAWSRRVGVLRTPALLVARRDDAASGPDIQASLVAPHFTRSRIHVVAGLDVPFTAGLAALVVDAAEAPPSPSPEPAIDPAYAEFVASDRVTRRTREVVLARAKPLPPSPVVLTPPLLAILRAVTTLVLPQDDAHARVDIARRIDEVLAGGGDGWRHASLPPDAEAMAQALHGLDDAARAAHGRPFLCLDASHQQDLLDAAERGELAGRLGGAAMALWFSELRREAVRAWISHPAVLGRLGYSGIGSVGGDTLDRGGPVKHGCAQVGPDSREAWEPRAW